MHGRFKTNFKKVMIARFPVLHLGRHSEKTIIFHKKACNIDIKLHSLFRSGVQLDRSRIKKGQHYSEIKRLRSSLCISTQQCTTTVQDAVKYTIVESEKNSKASTRK